MTHLPTDLITFFTHSSSLSKKEPKYKSVRADLSPFTKMIVRAKT